MGGARARAGSRRASPLAAARRTPVEQLPHLPDAGRRVADRARAARGVRREGAARGQAQHELDRARRGATRTRVKAFCRALYDAPRRSCATSSRSPPRSRAAGDRAALGQLLLKLTVPGVPDIYQGDELLCLSLVDPDNRRPVDWEAPPRAARRARRRRRADRETRKLQLIVARAGAARAAARRVRRRLRAAGRRPGRRARSCAAASVLVAARAARRRARRDGRRSRPATGATCSASAASAAGWRSPRSSVITASRCSSELRLGRRKFGCPVSAAYAGAGSLRRPVRVADPVLGVPADRGGRARPARAQAVGGAGRAPASTSTS